MTHAALTERVAMCAAAWNSARSFGISAADDCCRAERLSVRQLMAIPAFTSPP